MKYTYLLIHIATLAGPLALSFDKKVAFYKKWKYLLPAILITAVFFLVWDYLFTAWSIWSFNDEYILGIKFFGLPLEEILFFFTVPYACVFVYECLKIYLKKDYLKKVAVPVSLLFIVGLGFLIYFNYGNLYTACVAIFSLAYLIQLLVYKASYLGRFYLAWLVCLIPLAIINGILTYLPVVIYNETEIMGIRLGSIPFEDFIYFFLLLMMNVSLYYTFQRRARRKRNEQDEEPEPQPPATEPTTEA